MGRLGGGAAFLAGTLLIPGEATVLLGKCQRVAMDSTDMTLIAAVHGG